jgi:hypothetical protein
MKESFLEKVIKTLRWCKDVNEGEMIECAGYHRTYFNVSSPISQRDLDDICCLVNPILRASGHSFKIINTMGEIHPVYTIGGRNK